MTARHETLARARAFAERFGLRAPILMAPMAGASPVALAAAVSDGGGMGACGALTMAPQDIAAWARAMRERTNGAFQMNLWIPDPAPERDPAREAAAQAFVARWHAETPPPPAALDGQDFEAQCAAVIEAGPVAMSSIMGLYPPDTVAAMNARGIAWLATATTLAEAIAAEEAGADAIIAQGAEAGGHRGTFDEAKAEASLVGLFSLVPAIADAVAVPVIATGGIAEARGIAAALLLGASGVQIGTALLRTPEAGIPAVWADAIARARPEDTVATRAFSGRLGRSLATDYTRAAAAPDAPRPAPYPIQRALTRPMAEAAKGAGDLGRMQAWAGQSAGRTETRPAATLIEEWWRETEALLG